jgi:antitoxin HicB
LTDGKTLEHAKEMASQEVSGIIETYLEQGIRFSIPSIPGGADFHAIPLEPGLAFAMWMRNRRESRSMTLAEVAAKYQVCQKLENPRTANPTLKTICKVEKVFNDELIAL